MDLVTELVVPTDRRFLGRDAADFDMLKIVGVDPRWTEYVRVLDHQGDLALLHYLSTWVSSTDHTIDEKPLAEIGCIRGTIIDTAKRSVVCSSFPYTPEVVSNEQERLGKFFPSDLSTCTFYNACEGTVLRLFWFEDKWHISTHRKINADNSYWAGPTFGAMFKELREFDMESLNKDHCYALLMSHNSNRLVYHIPTSQLMVIAIYDRQTGRFLKTEDWGELPLGTIYPTPILGIQSMSDLLHAVNEMGTARSFDRAGIITFGDEENPHPVKILNSNYCKLRDARGNEPSLRLRYLQIRGSTECDLIVEWFDDPDTRKIFDEAEDEIDDLVDKLHALYMHRYVRRNYDQVTKEEFVTIQRCHNWHNTDRGNNIVTKVKVREILSGTPNHYLLIMLNRQRQERRAEALAKQKTFEEGVHPEC